MKNAPLADMLQHLPAFEPDTALWQRICDAHQRRLRERRWRAGAALLAAAAVVVIAVTVLPRPDPSPPADAGVASWQQQSRVLETQLRSLQADSRSDPRLQARLRLIDFNLQAAYDRAADVQELSALWRERSEALRGLIATRGDDVAITHI